jgi:hypothetical protein
MRKHATVVAVALGSLVTAGGARAATPEAECEAAQLAAMGQRISTKLHCRAWAKLTGIEVPAECLQAAEDQFLSLIVSMGPECADPGSIVDLGASADATMSAAAATVDPAPSIPDLNGTWVTRTVLGPNPGGADALVCGGAGEPTCPEVFVIIECRTQLTQEGETLHQLSECGTTPDSPEYLPSFRQEGSGPIDRVTGEYSFEGSVDVPNVFVAHYKGEGVFSPDGSSLTAVTTAGLGSGWLWLAATSGERVKSTTS